MHFTNIIYRNLRYGTIVVISNPAHQTAQLPETEEVKESLKWVPVKSL